MSVMTAATPSQRYMGVRGSMFRLPGTLMDLVGSDIKTRAREPKKS